MCELPYAAKSSDTAGGAGGTCVIRGCVPKKLLVYGAHYAEEFKDAQGFGWALPGAQPAHDWASLMASKDKEIQRLSGIYGRILGNAGVTVRRDTHLTSVSACWNDPRAPPSRARPLVCAVH